MVTAADCLKKYGAPEKQAALTIWDVPPELEQGVLPHKLYCNRDMIVPLQHGFKNLIERGLIGELKTWDGCFNIRTQRGYTAQSLHSWAIAFDCNAASNPLGKPPTLSAAFVQCFKDAGFDWGGDWASRKDGMHFQLAKI